MPHRPRHSVVDGFEQQEQLSLRITRTSAAWRCCGVHTCSAVTSAHLTTVLLAALRVDAYATLLLTKEFIFIGLCDAVGVECQKISSVYAMQAAPVGGRRICRYGTHHVDREVLVELCTHPTSALSSNALVLQVKDHLWVLRTLLLSVEVMGILMCVVGRDERCKFRHCRRLC